MNRISIYVLLSWLFFSCSSKEKRIDSYYITGELKSTEYYNFGEDKFPVKIINYYVNGNVKDSISFDSNGNRNGNCYFFDTLDQSYEFRQYKTGKLDGWTEVRLADGLKLLRPFKNDSAYGIQYFYDKNKLMTEETLWLGDSPVAGREIKFISKGDTLSTNNNLLTIKDTLKCLAYYLHNEDGSKFYTGHIDYNNNKYNLNSKYNNYHIVEMKDTIVSGEPLKIHIHNYLLNIPTDHYYLVVRIGKMNKDLEMLGEVRQISRSNGMMDFEFELENYEVGYNLLLGQVDVMKDTTVIRRTLLFEDFTVLP